MFSNEQRVVVVRLAIFGFVSIKQLPLLAAHKSEMWLSFLIQVSSNLQWELEWIFSPKLTQFDQSCMCYLRCKMRRGSTYIQILICMIISRLFHDMSHVYLPVSYASDIPGACSLQSQLSPPNHDKAKPKDGVKPPTVERHTQVPPSPNQASRSNWFAVCSNWFTHVYEGLLQGRNRTKFI